MKKFNPQLIWWTFRAFIANTYIEFRNTRLERSKRKWTALKLGGGGKVPLGKVNQETAISKATRLGNVSFVDPETAIIFYSVNL